MRVIGANDDEVGVVLTKAEAAVLVAALAGNDIKSIDRAMHEVFGQTLVNPLKHVMPMFDWLKKWVKEEL